MLRFNETFSERQLSSPALEFLLLATQTARQLHSKAFYELTRQVSAHTVIDSKLMALISLHDLQVGRCRADRRTSLSIKSIIYFHERTWPAMHNRHQDIKAVLQKEIERCNSWDALFQLEGGIAVKA